MRGNDVIAAKFGAKWIRKDQTSNKFNNFANFTLIFKIKKGPGNCKLYEGLCYAPLILYHILKPQKNLHLKVAYLSCL